ncbi:MAG: Gfo/Idh/MocA family oxidoreductase [Kiritimatiellia bacterium]|nr:Gfo/Idh/MocA family oxidoreductase [Kiritimatiellia bacterium]MDP6629622.1 Gfo/Idh/MocA family oxidoreductase [Kiritimatiellia bacterium]MDP6809329.1 Gfo/Idh/MocA family oxidoreductase [Kiritimatiellia bacterium]MDP7023068.1 Gfo/Idh/MocA family oxidoreductase [Kiritimatiellia bacterium]
MSITRSYRWQSPDVGEAGSNGNADACTLRVGLVGLGLMGDITLCDLLARTDVMVTALCDVDASRLAAATEKLSAQQGAGTVTCFRDFRELHRREDVDAVIISTPDHWHAIQGIDAMRCGKDVYIEKPLTLTIAEGRRLCDVASETERVCQTGSQQRSAREFRHACELIRNGAIGEVQSVAIRIPPPNRHSESISDSAPVPQELDYDLWLGPAPWRPYREETCHYAFRYVSDFSGGQMTNWGAHNLDIVQWALNADSSGPVRVKGTGVFPQDGIYDTPTGMDVTWDYASGAKVHCTTGKPRCTFIGTAGTITVGRGHFEATPIELEDAALPPDAVRLYRSDDHMGNFLDCVRSRQQTICPMETGHRSATVCHLGNIAMRLGRALEWDPVSESFANDDEANAMRSRPMRAPWSLD